MFQNSTHRALDQGDRRGFSAIAPTHPVAFGLDLLGRSPPLWPIGAEEWVLAVRCVVDFAKAWDSSARGAGWYSLELYGLHHHAPYARLSAMGAAWLAARAGCAVVGLTSEAITLASRTGARQRIYHHRPEPDAALAWDLV
jgi:hypothetical protein